MPPLVSVLMAVYNGEKYLATAIESILRQTWTDFEFLIIDDASQDETAQILSAYARQDPRLRVLTNPQNLGLTRSLNLALRHAEGVYIARQDSDDMSLPERLALQVSALQGAPNPLVAGTAMLIDAEGNNIGVEKRPFSPWVGRWLLGFYNVVGAHSGVLFRREAALALGGYAEAYRYSQDYDLWRRLTQKSPPLFLNVPLVQWRQHPHNLSAQKAAEQERLSLDISQAYWQVWGVSLSHQDLRLLRAFWRDPFPSITHIPSVQNWLRTLYQHFCAHNHSLAAEDKKQIRVAIAERFVRWSREWGLKQWGVKLRLLRAAARWDVNASLGEIRRLSAIAIKGGKHAQN